MNDDLARHLPDPPPPRPAARRDALTTAMAHFDGTETPAGPHRAPRARWRRLPGAVGAFASIALVALVGIPMALDHRDAPGDVARQRPAADTLPERMDRMRTTSAPASSARVATASVAAPPVATIRLARPVEAPAAAPALPPASAAVAEDSPPPPPAPPPPPPPAPAPVTTLAATPPAAMGEITVTGARVAGAARRTDERRAGCAEDSSDPACAPGAADVALRAGLSALETGDSIAAIAAFDRAIALRPRLAVAYLNRALAYRQRGDLARAESDVDRALRYDRSARAYRIRSDIRASRGNTSGAAEDRDRAGRIDERDGKR